MTAEACPGESIVVEMANADVAGASVSRVPRDAISIVEKVARVVSDVSLIDEARNALCAAGWTATIAANRVTVNGEVSAEFIPAKIGTFGLISARWVIYSRGGRQPVWIVGVNKSDCNNVPTFDD